MSDFVIQRNVAALISPRLAAAITAIVAAGTGDATAVTGIVIDRAALKMPLNAELTLAFTAVLAATKTLSLGTVKIQDSADGTNFADFLTFTDPGVVATGPAGGGTVNGQVSLPAHLAGARQYIRTAYTPDLSATSVDTAMIAETLTFAGFDRLPSP